VIVPELVPPALVWRAGPGWRMLASTVLGGGLGERTWVLNAQVDAGYARLDPDQHLRGARMPRPKWEPDERQAAALNRAAALRDTAIRADAEFRAAVKAAADLGVIPTAIAERLGMERKSAYRLLGHKYS